MYLLNRIKYLILILFVGLLSVINVHAIVKPTNEFYINDYANILSSDIEEYILEKSIALNNAEGTQIVVVTVPNLEGISLENYANKLFNEFGIGDKEKNNGLLLLLALEEREFRVEVGYGLEGILPDGKTGRFQDDYIIPYLKENDWDNGIKNGYDAFYSEIVKLNNLNIDYNEAELLKNNNENSDIYIVLIISLIFSGTIFGYIIANLKKKKTLFTIIYLLSAIILLIYGYFNNQMYSFCMIFNLINFLSARFGIGSSGSGRSSGGYRSSGSSYRSNSSSRSFSGGGGRSGGGGSSRKF